MLNHQKYMRKCALISMKNCILILRSRSSKLLHMNLFFSGRPNYDFKYSFNSNLVLQKLKASAQVSTYFVISCSY